MRGGSGRKTQKFFTGLARFDGRKERIHFIIRKEGTRKDKPKGDMVLTIEK